MSSSSNLPKRPVKTRRRVRKGDKEKQLRTRYFDAISELKELLERAKYQVLNPSEQEIIYRINSWKIGTEHEINQAENRDWGHVPKFSVLLERFVLSSDPLLAYCVLNKAGDAKSCQELEPQAILCYVAQYRSFDKILGDWIPEELRTAAASKIKEQNYQRGTNLLAIDDWQVFLSRRKKMGNGITTGTKAIDEALGGGLTGLTIVAGDEGKGKSSFVLEVVKTALLADPELGCVILSLDQTKDETLNLLARVITGLPSKELWKERGTSDQATEFENATALMEVQHLLARVGIVQRRELLSGAIDLPRLKTIHNQFIMKSGVKKVLLVIDLFQSLTQLCQQGSANETDEFTIALIKDYHEWSVNSSNPLGSVVLLTSEVRKKDSEFLTNDDVRGSARLASAVTNVMLLSSAPGTPQSGEEVGRILKIGKSRNGSAGERIPLTFHHKIGQFSEAKHVESKPKSYRSKKSSNDVRTIAGVQI